MKRLLANTILAIPVLTFLIVLFACFLVSYPFYWAFCVVKDDKRDLEDYYGI